MQLFHSNRMLNSVWYAKKMGRRIMGTLRRTKRLHRRLLVGSPPLCRGKEVSVSVCVWRWGCMDVEGLLGAVSSAQLCARVYLQKQRRRARPDVTNPCSTTCLPCCCLATSGLLTHSASMFPAQRTHSRMESCGEDRHQSDELPSITKRQRLYGHLLS